MKSVQTVLTQRMAHIEQSAAAHRLLVSEGVKKFSEAILQRIDDGLAQKDHRHACQEPRGFIQHEDGHPQREYGNRKPTTLPFVSSCLQIPRLEKWYDAVEQWKKGCPQKNLTQALKDWPHGVGKGKLKDKFYDRKLIVFEYLRLEIDKFIDKYNPDNVTIKELKKKIRMEKDSMVEEREEGWE